jgi:hypothetical protein
MRAAALDPPAECRSFSLVRLPAELRMRLFQLSVAPPSPLSFSFFPRFVRALPGLVQGDLCGNSV